MSNLTSAYLLLALFAGVAVLLNIQWLVYSMLLLIAVLIAAESLSPHRLSHAATNDHAKKETSSHKEPAPSNFMDTLLANLIAGKHLQKEKKHKDEEEKKEEEKKKEKKEKTGEGETKEKKEEKKH